VSECRRSSGPNQTDRSQQQLVCKVLHGDSCAVLKGLSRTRRGSAEVRGPRVAPADPRQRADDCADFLDVAS